MAYPALQLWYDFVSIVFPENCVACGTSLVKGESHLCSHCRLNLPLADSQLKNRLLKNKFAYEPKITYVNAYLTFQKSGSTQKLLHQLKYRGNRDLGIKLGAWFGGQLLNDSEFRRFDLLLPVPLHKRKLRMRGYNQSAAIAEGMALVTGIPAVETLMERTRFTSTQTKKHKVERWENVERVFNTPRPDRVRGRKIILIDDVLTTGSTLATCAGTLIDAGAEEVGICALAMATK